MGRSRSRRHISSEPLINLVHLRFEWIIAGMVTLFILLTTCLPILNTPDAQSAAPAQATALSGQDIIQNVVLYMPLGFFLCLASYRLRRSWTDTIVATSAIALALSIIAELMQQHFPGRTSSVTDVLCNLCGAASGWGIAAAFRLCSRMYRHRLREQLRTQPMLLTFLLALALYGVVSLVPHSIDLTPNTEQSFLSPARLMAFMPSASIELTATRAGSRALYDHIFDLASAWLVLSVLGYLCCCSLLLEYRFSRLASIILVLSIVMMFSSGWVVLRTFVIGLGFQPVLILVATGGALAGGSAACIPGLECGRHHPPSPVWAWSAVLVTVVLIAARELNPFVFNLDGSSLRSQISLHSFIPLRQYFTGHTLAAASDLIMKFGRFFALGVFLLAALRPLRIALLRKRLRIGTAVALIFGLAIEIAQLACPSRWVDITHLLLAVAGVISGMIAMQWWLDLTHAQRLQTMPAHALEDQAPVLGAHQVAYDGF